MQDDDKEFVREFFEDVEKRYKKEWDDFLAKVGGYSNLVELTREMEELYRTNAYAQRDLTKAGMKSVSRLRGSSHRFRKSIRQRQEY